ncbi:MAG: nicotinate-nucleotide adenylyltransferase [Clostridium celatum]|nr:nicotinate-nucleotide adenylyltransferase [Clostridium celatum]MDU2121311.1 nicotinate-nucleotide adenylyltransferase [Clostridium celatum]MDU4979702.1 nicotinate-nucleotide adenylyltransferase [Clostridium celatum]
MKRYGMMGGTFNPIHLAHLYIAYEAKETLNLDKVIFMVAGNPPHKKESSVIDSNYRYDMVKMAIKDYPGFEISDYEIQKQGYSYTYETLKYLKGDEGEVELFFIAGADSLMDIEKWKNPELVLSNCTFVAFNRGEYDKETLERQKKKLQDKYNSNIILLDISNLDISSSMIRERIINGKRVDFFIPEKVKKYIEQNKLYRGD